MCDRYDTNVITTYSVQDAVRKPLHEPPADITFDGSSRKRCIDCMSNGGKKSVAEAWP